MKHQLMTLFICAVIIPVISISAILDFYIYKRTISHYENLAYSQDKLIHSTIVSTSIHLHSLYETIISNSQFQELLSTNDPKFDSMKTISELTDSFNNILENTAMLTTLQVYVSENLMQNVKANKYILPITKEEKRSRWYKKSQEIFGNFWISDIRTGQNEIDYWELHYCCRIPVPKKNTYALLLMSVSNNYLRNLITNNNYQIYLNINEEPVFISSDRRYSGKKFPLNINNNIQNSKTGTFVLFDKKVIGSFETANLYHSSDKLHIFVADTNALPTTYNLIIISVLIVLLALIISAVIIFLYANYFGERINTLRLAMYKVSKNDYEIVDTIKGDDELTATFHDMKIMVEKLKLAEAQIYQAQIREQVIKNQQQQMEFKLLANQINPHFLYNTLETIRMKAFIEGNRDVANAIKLLSKSMRYVLSNTKTSSITLEKELDYISTYMAIMKLRFGSRINYDIKIDESIISSEYMVLPIMLQPIIENAISHGLKDIEENGHIILKIRPSKNRSNLNIYIFDNGVGMSKEKLLEVIVHLNTPVKDSDHGIGLYNINNRIHLFYGNEYGITIKSKENLGTCVTVTIPLHQVTQDKMEEEEK